MMPRQNDLSISQKGIVLVSVPLVAASIFLLVLGVMLYQSQEEIKRDSHAKDVLLAVQQTSCAMSDGLVSVITLCLHNNDERSLKKFKRAIEETNEGTARFERLVSRYPLLKERQLHWYNTIKRETKLAQAIQESFNYGELGGILVNRCVSTQVQVLMQHEKTTRHHLVVWLEERQRQYKSNASKLKENIARLLTLALAMNGGISILLAAYYSKTINRRLETLVDNSHRLAEGKELNPKLEGLDEIGRLDRVFHHMALELHEAQSRQKAIVENAIDVIASLDKECRFTEVNAAAVKTWGYAKEFLIGKSFFEIMHGEDSQIMLVAMHTISSGQQKGSLECRLVKEDGSVMHIRWSVSWLADEETYYCVAHDITQRTLLEALLKESEQVKRLILESMPLGLVIVDQKGLIETVNTRTRQMFQYADSEIVGQPVNTLFSADAAVLQKALPEEVYGIAFDGTQELLARTRDGDTFPVELTFSNYFVINEKKVVVVIADITERHEMERLKRAFVAMVSHDLRTPLSTILGSMQLFREGVLGKLNPVGEKQVATAEKDLERLTQLVNTLLDIEQLEAGQMELHKKPVDMSSVILQSIDSVLNLAEEKAIKIEGDVDDCHVEGDSATLVQVLVNLLGNAIKFSPEGSTILISAKTDIDGTTVEVKDQGRGIPEHLQKDIFERFKQVESADRTEKKGSGLGLAICRLIVEVHGGMIGVKSKMGEGSTFWFSLPATRPTE